MYIHQLQNIKSFSIKRKRKNKENRKYGNKEFGKYKFLCNNIIHGCYLWKLDNQAQNYFRRSHEVKLDEIKEC